MIFSGYFNRVVHIVNYENTAHKRLGYIFVFLVDFHERIGKPNHTFFRKCLCDRKLLRVLNTCEGQKGRPSPLRLFQIGNHPFRSLFFLCDNILNITTQGSLNGSFILFVHLHNICHDTDNSRLSVLPFHDAFDASAITLISFCQIRQRFQFGFFLMIERLCPLELLIPSCQFRLDLANTRFQSSLFSIQLPDCISHSLKLFLQPADRLFLLRLVRFGSKQSGI